MSEPEVIREFLIESNENLNRLDQELVELEQRPDDKKLLASVFRTVHTIKGTCGFLGFPLLEHIAHQAENLLSRIRSGEIRLSQSLTALLLECLDAFRRILATIEATTKEGPEVYDDLIAQLEAAANGALSEQGEQPQASGAEAERSAVAESAIRVDVGLLDKLMNLVGELVLARNQILQFTAQNEDGGLNATSQRLNLITTELQEGVMKTRMQPIGVVWNKLPRLVRDTAQACGKQVKLEMEGAGTELDRTIIEAIKDPLTHLVRNACDHGIEAPPVRVRAGKPGCGTLSLKAYHEGGQVNIEIADNGGGIDSAKVRLKAVENGLIGRDQAAHMSDEEAVRLIFQPGFSTATEVTNISGRGVGLDVVRANVERIGGVVDVTSVAGQGTTIKLKIPLTLAIIPGLVVTSGGERFLIPQASLLELIRIDGDSAGRIEWVSGTPVYRRRGRLLPVAFLDQVLNLKAHAQTDAVNIVVLKAEDHEFGLVVESIKDTQEIVVKPMGKQLKGLSVYAGAAIMGDGHVALILDVLGIGHRSSVLAHGKEETQPESQAAGAAPDEAQRLLLFRAGSFERLAVSLSLVARLEEFPCSAVEQAGGRQVVQYRGGILTMASLAGLLETDRADSPATRDPVQAVVFTDGERSLGVIVDQILDVVEESVTIRQTAQRQGLLGSAVIGKQVTDLLDVRWVIERAAPEWLQKPAGAKGTTILIAESSSFARGLLRSELEMAGYRVAEAVSLAETLVQMERREIGAVLADREIRDAIHCEPAMARLPVLDVDGADREGMLRSLEELVRAVEPAVREQEVRA